LEHELTWTYYHMRRHDGHPLRLEVGETLPIDSVPPPMRMSKSAAFRFWTDLRPPFKVVNIERTPDEGFEKNTDGELFQVAYQCGIDYCSERAYGETSTFDNVCHGVATMRIPDDYPRRRPVFLSWGRPSLGMPEERKQTNAKASAVSPAHWMPIAQELNLPANHPRLGKCREASRRATEKKRGLEVSPLQKMLLGPHMSLPKLVEHEEAATRLGLRSSAGGGGLEESPGGFGGGLSEGGSPSPPRGATRKREHRIYTAAAGFVRYSG